MKNYNVNRIEKNALQINGLGNNSLWNNAETLTDFISPWDDLEPEKIELRALWDTEYIYFSYKVYDTNIHIDRKDDSVDSIAESDRVEIFFRTDEALNPYYCLEIDPTPRIMDFIAYPNKKFDYDWNWPENDISVKSNIKEDYFVVEIAISIQSLKNFHLIKDNIIETGFYRAKYKKQENNLFEPTWITWINPNTETPNFHIASSFGTLTLE
ncbi:carbohydrate-binding family 9-like protein [Flavobacterium sp. ANB]|uniref:carbohydrate-binding family 9-like protein n=1 Tax=unclassified Flavobacterium TaxID=196869 RepID=UPI0012B86E3F|nr:MULTISPECIES: carbohydrate-binding family 9-like protein [unclassified Flavobacterium]MBF4517008.1 carbohydrate-binding family 9-like protein [Flavobacterium sp. ANB]MTD69096.1 endoxylanase [Flavobacterium sp. LC2016-13]